jgi:hypothetical protein
MRKCAFVNPFSEPLTRHIGTPKAHPTIRSVHSANNRNIPSIPLHPGLSALKIVIRRKRPYPP